MRSVLTVVVGALALMATGPASVGPSPAAGTPRSAIGGGSAHTPRAATPRSASAIAHEIIASARGTYSATYGIFQTAVPGEPATEVVTVAQRADPGRVAWPTNQGEWMYRVTTQTGTFLQWVEVGARATWCQRLRRGAPMQCGGPVTYVRSNGFTELLFSFIPGMAAQGLSTYLASAAALRHGETVRPDPALGAGAVCLSVPASSSSPEKWCVDGRRLESVQTLDGPEAFGAALLESWSPRASPSAFAEPGGCPARCRHVTGLPGV